MSRPKKRAKKPGGGARPGGGKLLRAAGAAGGDPARGREESRPLPSAEGDRLVTEARHSFPDDDWPALLDPAPLVLRAVDALTPADLAAAFDDLGPAEVRAWARDLGMAVHKVVTPATAAEGLTRMRTDVADGYLAPAGDLVPHANYLLGASLVVPSLWPALQSATIDDDVRADVAAAEPELLPWLERWVALPVPLRRLSVAVEMTPLPEDHCAPFAPLCLWLLAGAPSCAGEGALVALDDETLALLREQVDAVHAALVAAEATAVVLDSEEDELAAVHEQARIAFQERDALVEQLAELMADTAIERADVMAERRDHEQALTALAAERARLLAEAQIRETELVALRARVAGFDADTAVASAQRAAALAQEQADVARAEAAEAISEQVELTQAVDDLSARVRWLERELAKATGQPAPVERALPEAPTSLLGCVRLAREHLGQLHIGDTDEAAAELDAFGEKARVWARKAWLVLRALDDYVAARKDGYAGDVFTYLDAPPAGRAAFQRTWYAPRESETVQTTESFRRARVFPVPEWVLPAGEAYMDAHVKLQEGGKPAPRLHFFDDTGGPSKAVWVGYLGAHLPNSLTN